jgi:MoxR-like ATPase
MLRGRRYVLPEDVADLVPDVMRHRLVLSYEALAEGRSADDIVGAIMAKVPLPEKPMQHSAEGASGA